LTVDRRSGTNQATVRGGECIHDSVACTGVVCSCRLTRRVGVAETLAADRFREDAPIGNGDLCHVCLLYFRGAAPPRTAELLPPPPPAEPPPLTAPVPLVRIPPPVPPPEEVVAALERGLGASP